MSNYKRWFGVLSAAVALVSTFVNNLQAQVPGAVPNVARTTLLESVYPGGGSYHVNVTWDATAGADSYNVYRSVEAGDYTLYATGVTNLFFDDSVGGCGTYNYYVMAVNVFGEGLPSAVASGNPCDCPIFTVPWYDFETTRTTANIRWANDDVRGADGMLEAGLSMDELASVYYNTNLQGFHSYLLTNLQPETVYWYRLTSYNPDGNGQSFAYYFTTAPTNRPPIAHDQTILLGEDQFYDIELTADVGAPWEYYDVLTYQVVSLPAHGSLQFIPGYSSYAKYVPDPNWFGTDSFTFKANDGEDDSQSASVTVTVLAINDRPVIENRTLTTTEDTPGTLILTGADVEGDALTFAYWWGSAPEPTNGTVQINGDQLVYTPFPNAVGEDVILYWAEDAAYGQSEMATITVTITPVNDAPVANAQSISTLEDTAVNLLLSGSDVEGDILAFSITTSPVNGMLSGVAPNLIYTPAANFHGTDQLTFAVSDGNGGTSSATVVISVSPVNDVPAAENQNVSTTEDVALSIILAGTDADGDAVSFAVAGQPAHGTLSGAAPNLSYTPAANFNGADVVAFEVSDGHGGTSSGTISITVLPANDPPIANPQNLVVAEDGSVNVTLSGSDLDGDALAFSVVSGPTSGTLSGAVPNLTYSPAANFSGNDQFVFRVTDPSGTSSTAAVSLAVIAVNDAPVANAQSVSTPASNARAITLTGSDVEGSALTYTVLTTPAHGTLSGTAPNLTYTPTAGYSGPDSFTFRVNDGAADSATATVSITVTAPTSVPAAPNGLVATAVSTSRIDLTWNDNSNSEDGFKIERSTNNSSFTEIGTVGPGVRNFSSMGLASNKTYYYRVRAYNTLGNSAYSNTASAKTLR